MLPPGGRRPHDRLQTGFDNRLESHLNPAIHPNPSFKTASEIAATNITKGSSLRTISEVFGESSAPTSRFPGDAEFLRALRVNPLYSWLSNGRLGDLLWELELAIRSQFTEAVGRPDPLWVEHIMPQSWTVEWPDSEGNAVPREGTDPQTERRSALIHTLGNLTLTSDRLNISMGNEAFGRKLSKLDQESLFILNKNLRKYPCWTEKEIVERGDELARLALAVVPDPTALRAIDGLPVRASA